MLAENKISNILRLDNQYFNRHLLKIVGKYYFLRSLRRLIGQFYSSRIRILELEEFQSLEYLETPPNGNSFVNIETNIIHCC